jgi:aminoglycoside 2''-phosphotransferase
MRIDQPGPMNKSSDAAERRLPGQVSVDDLVATVVGTGAVRDVREARLVTDGMQHIVVVLDEQLVARFPRDEAAAASLRDETTLLTRLAGQLTVPLPVPLHIDHRFTLHRMLHGSVTSRASLESLAPAALERLLDDVARFLSELAAADAPDLATSPATASVDQLRQLRQRAEACIVPSIWRHQRIWFEETFAAVESMSFEHTPSVIHGDLAPYHVLHHPESGRLTGVLDFGVSGLGDPAVDLGCLLSVWGEKFAGGLARSWPAAAALADRGRLLATILPLEWAVTSRETQAADLAFAHLGHLAIDINRIGTPFGPVA